MTVGGSGSSGHSQSELGKLTWVGMRVGLELGDDGPIGEVPSPLDGGVSTPWISIPPAATGGEGRIGEEGAVELLGVVTCDIKFFRNKNYSRSVITAHETNRY